MTVPVSASAFDRAALTARLTSPTRLAALRATGLLDAGPNPVLDRIARLVAKLLGTPIGAVTLITDKQQIWPGLHGMDEEADASRLGPISHSFCQYVVASEAPFVVTDARAHAVVKDNPATTELPVGAYIGVPLRSTEGETLGSLCAIDHVPVEWTKDHLEILEDLAAAAVAEIELRITARALLATQERLELLALRDPLTGLLNRRGFAEQARHHLALAQRMRQPFLICALDLNDFKAINDTRGHDAGDAALVDMATLLQHTFRDCDIVARDGGDEFVALVTSTDDAEGVVHRLRAALRDRNAASPDAAPLASSIGVAIWKPEASIGLAELMRMADAAMYAEKRATKAQRPTGAKVDA